MRWFGLACFIILLVLAWRRKELKNYAFSLIVGCLVGLTIDSIGIRAGMWYFPRQPFLSLEYILIVIPCWGVFGATINMVDDWYLKKSHFDILIIWVSVMALYELPNLLSGSWEYTANPMIVTLGWLPLILVYRYSYLILLNKWRMFGVTSKNRAINSD